MSKPKPLLFSIRTLPYPGIVTITTELSADKIIRYLNRHHNAQIEPNSDIATGIKQFAEDPQTLARTTRFNNGRTLIQFHPNPPLATVAHELIHATYNTLNYVSVDLRDEEAFAYLFDYFLSEAISKLKVRN